MTAFVQALHSDDGMPAPRDTAEQPTVELIHALAKDGLTKTGHDGELVAMGVPRSTLPQWDDIQLLTAQLATRPLFEDDEVGTDLVIGPNAVKPLRLNMPLFVSDRHLCHLRLGRNLMKLDNRLQAVATISEDAPSLR